MSIIFAKIFLILVAIFFIYAVTWFISLPWRINRAYERYRIYGDNKPVLKLEKKVLVIDWKTFGLSRVKRFFARKFSRVIIVLESGKELCFYNGIQGGAFTYEGKLSVTEELQYQAIKEYIG